jgi:hypothetical protein
MIVFQSSLADVAEPPSLNQRSTTGTSSPGGSNERSECRFVCSSGVGRGEGELPDRGRQSALIEAGRSACHAPQSCPSGHLKIAQPFMTGTITPNQSKVRQGRQKSVFIGSPRRNRGEGGCPSVVKKHVFAKRTQIENRKVLPISWMCKNGLASFSKRTHFLLGPWPFKAFQRFLEKKLYFFIWPEIIRVRVHSLNSRPRLPSARQPLPTYARLCQPMPATPPFSFSSSSSLATISKPYWLKTNRLDG